MNLYQSLKSLLIHGGTGLGLIKNAGFGRETIARLPFKVNAAIGMA